MAMELSTQERREIGPPSARVSTSLIVADRSTDDLLDLLDRFEAQRDPLAEVVRDELAYRARLQRIVVQVGATATLKRRIKPSASQVPT